MHIFSNSKWHERYLLKGFIQLLHKKFMFVISDENLIERVLVFVELSI